VPPGPARLRKLVVVGLSSRVVVTLHQRGKPHDSDSWVEMHYGLIYTVEDGLIVRADFYETPESAIEAAGLQE
jgi:ketosteroid isomerase-like protein